MNKFIFTVVLMVSAIGGFAAAQGMRGTGGGGMAGQPIDGTAISPSSVTTGSVTSTGPISVAAGQNLCLDGPACLTRFNYNSGVNNLDYFQNNAIRLAITPGGSVQAQLGFNANVASGAYGYACTNVGCRIHLGNSGRYLVDDGSRLSSPSAIASSDFTKDDFNNLILTGRREDSASSVGIIMRNSFALTTAGSKLVSFRNPTTTEIASIDKDGAYTGLSCNATATSGSSFTGGNSSTSLTLTSNTTDSVTSGTVPAIRLQASQNITDTDLLMSVEDSAGNRRFTLSELGDITGIRDFSLTRYLFGLHAAFSGFFQRTPNAITIADSGGPGAATYTWTPTTLNSVTNFTCNDADGCDITMAETAKDSGQFNRATNIGTNSITFTDTAGVTEMAGNFTAGQWDTIEFVYTVDRFVEVSRSNN